MQTLIDFSFLLTISTAGVIGYWFRFNWNYTKFSTMRESGYHLLYNSIIFGFLILAVLFLLSLLLAYQFERLNNDQFGYSILNSYKISIYIVMLLGSFLPFLLNVIFRKNICLRRTMENYGDSLYLTILDSCKSGSFVELTLKNGKVFIGFPPKPLNIRYEYVDICLGNSSKPISIRAEEILTVKHVDP